MALRDYRRPPFPHRTWITGALYDMYASKEVLHCDVYFKETATIQYLEIHWNAGGRVPVALDWYKVEPDGLTPIWDGGFLQGRDVYWTRENNAIMRGVHRTVLAEVQNVEMHGKWARVVPQCHYVRVTDADCEIADNFYTPPKAYVYRTPNGRIPTLNELAEAVARDPSVLGKRRGRPPGSRNKAREARQGVTTEEALTVRKTLPDWL